MIFLMILVLGLLAYFPIFQYGFAQDDFIHLYHSQPQTFLDFLNFFNPFFHFTDIFHYRPLSTFVYFFVNHQLFGLNAAPFHIEAIILHLFNGFLFYKIVRKIWDNYSIGLLSATIYVVSSVHFLSLFYISSFQQIAATFFIFLAILGFLNKRYLLTSLSFLLALLCKETSIILPVLLVLVKVIEDKQTPVKNIVNKIALPILPVVVLGTIYLILRFSSIQNTLNEGEYFLTSNPWIVLQNLKWYLIWSLGLPEILSTYPSLKLDSLNQFAKDFVLAPFILFFATIFLISSGLLIRRKIVDLRGFIASIGLFFVALLPVLFLEGHKYPQYLDLPFLGFLPILAMFLTIPKNGLRLAVASIAVLSFLVLQLLTIKLTEQTHWSTHRANVAEFYRNIFQTYEIEPKTTVFFMGSEVSQKELSVTLAKNYALSVWTDGKVERTRYVNEPPQNLGQNFIIQPITVY